MAPKSREAFRTISEVAEWLNVPTHVLRFWESRFSQIKPVKRAGGRRYYRPSDMRIIGGVKVLLHDEGMTIRGVQKLFREEGIKHVSGFSPDLFVEEDAKKTIDHDTLEQASKPAGSATFTRSASRAPVETPSETTAEPGLFVHHGNEPHPDPIEIEATAEHIEAQPELPEPLVPANDVPDRDPDDDDQTFSNGNSVAARLALASRTELDAHRAALQDTFVRLKAHLDKAS